MNRISLVLNISLLLVISLMQPTIGHAHQPFCETEDLTAEHPWVVENPAVSVAFYANLYPEADLDYYVFEAEADDEVYLQMTIPDIEGQEEFVPMMAILGPGLDEPDMDELPEDIEIPDGYGVLIVPMVEEPEQFYEPFGRDYYWTWQDITFEVPEDGEYRVVVWHPDEELGRYTFVVGKQERFGGSLDCLRSLDRDYWMLLKPGESPYMETDAHHDDD